MEIRGEQCVPYSPIGSGRFGRMFRRLPPCPALSDEQLAAIASGMEEAEPAPTGGWGSAPTPQQNDNPAIPAAYTYFGQFIDHDITFDPTSSLDRHNDPNALENFRSPRFDLDSLYGSGPDDEPFQYDHEAPDRLLVGTTDSGEPDLPRNSQGIALTGDPRNDENIIVSQLQLTFINLHNKLLQQVASEGATEPSRVFAEAQQRVRWHYQRVIVDDYLPRIIGQSLLDQLVGFDELTREAKFRLRHYRPKQSAYMPVEFSAAAFRFGHSQVRGVYDLNDVVVGRPIFIDGDDVGELDDLRGTRPLPQAWTIDWSHFLDIGGSNPQPSRLINTQIAPGLFHLPGKDQPLPLLNLRRGQALGLPSGQDVARFLGHFPIPDDQLTPAASPTPLWFYILRESEIEGAGQRLGTVGGNIVGQVLLGLLELDKTSWVNVNPLWTPTIPLADPARVTLQDIVTFAMT